MISLIAIIGKNRELGKNNRLIWHIPADLERFRTMTTGHPVIMGRKTFESIGKPLSGRTNIVISSNPQYSPVGVVVANALDEALEAAKKAPGHEEIFIIGGGSLYEQAIARADRLYLTVVDATAAADTFFPDYSAFSIIRFRETHPEHTPPYTYLTLEK